MDTDALGLGFLVGFIVAAALFYVRRELIISESMEAAADHWLDAGKDSTKLVVFRGRRYVVSREEMVDE